MVGFKYKGRNIGIFGDVVCFLFFLIKNFGCVGDGGMIVILDDDVVIIVRVLRIYGSGENG